MTPKVATCCYCGTRAALVLDKGRHELVCSSCGAPLHDMKMLRTEHPGKRHLVKASGGYHGPKRPKQRKEKRRKSLFRKILEEGLDVLEDIID